MTCVFMSEIYLMSHNTVNIMAEDSSLYDVIVVGAGIEGSATAYHLAKNGQKTLLIEQFPLPHSRGSSHGQSRIIRKAYGTDEHYTVMMKEAYPLWEQLERETNTKLFRQTGMLTFGVDGDDGVAGSEDCLKWHEMKYDRMNHREAKKRYPMLSYPEDYIFLLDYSGGILRSDKALKAFQDQFVGYGGELHDGEPVIEVVPGDVITVRTDKGEYKSKAIVLTVGPWATKLLPTLGIDVPLEVLRINVLYWKERQPGEYSVDKFPPMAGTSKETPMYALPSDEYPGHVKVCLHYGPKIDPDNRDDVDDSWVVEQATQYVKDHFPGLIPVPSIKETCIYTMTPDEDFLLDTHPSWKNVVIGAGFSGHGFKLAPVVGKVLAELAMEKSPSYDMKPFRMNRFPQPAKV